MRVVGERFHRFNTLARVRARRCGKCGSGAKAIATRARTAQRAADLGCGTVPRQRSRRMGVN